MKFLTVVAMFAFVAVQMSQAAPLPDEDKKDASPPAELLAASEPPAQPLAEVKAEVKDEAVSPSADAAPKEAPADAAKP